MPAIIVSDDVIPNAMVARNSTVLFIVIPTFTDKRPHHSDADHLVNEGPGYNGVAILSMADISGLHPGYKFVLVGSRVSLIDLLGVLAFRHVVFTIRHQFILTGC